MDSESAHPHIYSFNWLSQRPPLLFNMVDSVPDSPLSIDLASAHLNFSIDSSAQFYFYNRLSAHLYSSNRLSAHLYSFNRHSGHLYSLNRLSAHLLYSFSRFSAHLYSISWFSAHLSFYQNIWRVYQQYGIRRALLWDISDRKTEGGKETIRWI